MPSPFKETLTADISDAFAIAQPTWKGQDEAQLASTSAQLPGYFVDLVSADLMIDVSTPTESTYLYQYEITLRNAYPSSIDPDDVLTDLKLVAANAMHDALIGNATLSAPSYGALQDITGATFAEGELSAGGNRAYEVKVRYQIAITGSR